MEAARQSSVFHVERWDYDEQQLDGWDCYVGVACVAVLTVASEAALIDVIAGFGLRPADFDYPWNTADLQ